MKSFKTVQLLTCFFEIIIPIVTCVLKTQPSHDSDFTTISSKVVTSLNSGEKSTTIFSKDNIDTFVFPNDDTKYFAEETFLSNDLTDTAIEEELTQLRIQTVKLQILSMLKLKGPPRPASKSPAISSRETIRILLQESDRTEKNAWGNGEQRIVMQSKNSSDRCMEQCHWDFCRTFHFDLTTDFSYSRMSVWIYRSDDKLSDVLVTVYYSDTTSKKLHRKCSKMGWSKLDFPFKVPKIGSGSSKYSVQIEGPKIEDQGERRPFLMATKLSGEGSERRRRYASCNVNDSCCWRPLRVSFYAMGFDFVLYPEYLDINMCTGKCGLDHTEMKTHYERAMSQVLAKNARLHESLGRCWTLCCKPKLMNAVRVIYNDTDGIIHDHYIPDLSVKSCTCN